MLYKKTYRIESARHPTWNYGSNALYFVTICTKKRRQYFGFVDNERMILNQQGKIAQRMWQEIPQHFPFARLWAYRIMPNHVHGIIEIRKRHNVETQDIASLRGNQFGPQSRNLASIIRGYKAGVTSHIRQFNPSFAWQPRYYDVIIRSDEAFENISQYIYNNPAGWERDRNNPI